MQDTKRATTLDDMSLMDAIRRGDDDALGRWWMEYHPRLTAYIRSRNRALDAEDTASRVLERTAMALRSGGGPRESVAAYLFRAARNAIADAGPAFLLEDDLNDDADDRIAEPHSAVPAQLMINRTLGRLRPTDARLLQHVLIQGESVHEASTRMGVSPGVTSARLYQAKRAFQAVWVQDHVDVKAAPNECLPFRVVIGDVLSERASRETRESFWAHADFCSGCAGAADAAQRDSRRLGVLVPAILAPLGFVGGPAALLAAPWAGASAGTAVATGLAAAAGAAGTGAAVASAGTTAGAVAAASSGVAGSGGVATGSAGLAAGGGLAGTGVAGSGVAGGALAASGTTAGGLAAGTGATAGGLGSAGLAGGAGLSAAGTTSAASVVGTLASLTAAKTVAIAAAATAVAVGGLTAATTVWTPSQDEAEPAVTRPAQEVAKPVQGEALVAPVAPTDLPKPELLQPSGPAKSSAAPQSSREVPRSEAPVASTPRASQAVAPPAQPVKTTAAAPKTSKAVQSTAAVPKTSQAPVKTSTPPRTSAPAATFPVPSILWTHSAAWQTQTGN